MSMGMVRRGQLVTPFGVGAMQVLVNGSSVITAGLDHWYENDAGAVGAVNEFVVSDWRLQERLKVQQLRLPPDYRSSSGGAVANAKLSIPALRFPTWSFCIYCKRLEKSVPTLVKRPRCPDEKHTSEKPGRRSPLMSQVPFVVICENGHMDDFPWREWVHRTDSPTCQGVLRLNAFGGGTLAGQVVECDGCKQTRSLEGVTTVYPRGESMLSTQLQPGTAFECVGARPWLADKGAGCGAGLVAALRGAGNVYFPQVESSLFIPQSSSSAPPEVLDALRRPDVEPIAQLMRALDAPLTAQKLKGHASLHPILQHYSDEDLDSGIEELFGESSAIQSTGFETDEESDNLTGNADWRFPEFQLLRETPSHHDLAATDPGLPAGFEAKVSRVRRVEVLRETRALRGFTRLRDRPLKLSDGKNLLRRSPLPAQVDWLPAYEVRGEGIYLELDPNSTSAWAAQPQVRARTDRLQGAFDRSRTASGAPARLILPELVALHTLSHILINELVFTCGYGSASLRERLYVSADPGREMLGVLIYTAAGDSDGTMGGLARMALPSNLGPVLSSALQRATWCSTDPVCMELGEAGQGPGSCNLAACHACALLPETSCEEFNRFLDRGLLVGTHGSPELGMFPEGLATSIA